MRISARRGEIMVGVGDADLARTLQRIKFVNRHSVDGVLLKGFGGHDQVRNPPNRYPRCSEEA